MRVKPMQIMLLAAGAALIAVAFFMVVRVQNAPTAHDLVESTPTNVSQIPSAPAGTQDAKTGTPIPSLTAPPQAATPTVPAVTFITPPLTDAAGHITKKPFGLYVSPSHSPVSPERFQGYHTGVDFETTAAEQNLNVPVSAVCAGPLLLKKWANGYGGAAVQNCNLDGQAVTVIYGHLRLASISAKLGQELTPGEQIGVLGTGYSTETDGERKHLHLGIHQGSVIDIRGYVQSQSELAQWLDASKYLGP